jgi:uncharacterized membrane protein YuzA (DUF378 family)
MSKSEKIKEEIGWLKVVFGLLFATDLSLIAFLFNKIEELSIIREIFVLIGLAVVTYGLYLINKEAMKKIDELEEL